MSILNEIQEPFSNAILGRDYYVDLCKTLTDEHGFRPLNTRFAEGGCCDEINEPEYLFLEDYWGERFKFGGLAGYCHGGRTGLGAVSHHVPEEDGNRNLLLVAGPHIGYHEGQWGNVPRRGQPDITSSCGSLLAALGAGESLRGKEIDPLDLQQRKVESIVLDYLDTTDTPEVVSATRFMNEIVDKDLITLVDQLKPNFDGQIAVITGITINTSDGNYFAESKNFIV